MRGSRVVELPDGVRRDQQSIGGESPRDDFPVVLLNENDPFVALEGGVLGGLVDRIGLRQTGGGEALVSLVRDLMGVEERARTRREARPEST